MGVAASEREREREQMRCEAEGLRASGGRAPLVGGDEEPRHAHGAVGQQALLLHVRHAPEEVCVARVGERTRENGPLQRVLRSARGGAQRSAQRQAGRERAPTMRTSAGSSGQQYGSVRCDLACAAAAVAAHQRPAEERRARQPCIRAPPRGHPMLAAAACPRRQALAGGAAAEARHALRRSTRSARSQNHE
jgi:hypothetical protein